MKVSKAIEMLSELNADDDIALSWWGRELFTEDDDQPVSEEKWGYAVDEFDNAGGYFFINEQVWTYLWEATQEATNNNEGETK
jgi:hypothetical protein